MSIFSSSLCYTLALLRISNGLKSVNFLWDVLGTLSAIQIHDLCFSHHTHTATFITCQAASLVIHGTRKVDFGGGASKFRSAAVPKVQEGCWDLPGPCKALLTLLGPGTEGLEKAENSVDAELPEIKFIPDICSWHFRDLWGNLLLTFSFNQSRLFLKKGARRKNNKRNIKLVASLPFFFFFSLRTKHILWT